jgi:3-deoxy-D-manno-octulosonic-acid transferase
MKGSSREDFSTGMRWWLYNVLFALAYAVMMPHFLLRMKRRGGYRNRMGDRFGRYPEGMLNVQQGMSNVQVGTSNNGGPFPPMDIHHSVLDIGHSVWIHAVSVGEVYVAGQVMRALRARVPGIRFVFSTTSSTGWKEAEKQIGPGDTLIYNPLDFPPCVRRALDAVRPRALILTESEIWPNLIRACRRRGVPVFLVNARVSDRSAPGYRRLRFWFGPVLRMFAAIQAQSDEDKRRLVAAGADPATVEVTGSFKFDVASRDPGKERAVAGFLAAHGCGPGRVVLLGGSTWPGEDAALLRIYGRLRPRFPELRLVIVPRHFEKADAVQAEIERAGFACVRKSRCGTTSDERRTTNDVVLADTTGELMGFYGNADIVFVGKSLCEHGAQNMIEPCLCGAATLVGPNTENFRPVMSDLLEAGALIQVPDEAALAREIERLAGDAEARRALGARGVAAVTRRKGVVDRCADVLAARVSAVP